MAPFPIFSSLRRCPIKGILPVSTKLRSINTRLMSTQPLEHSDAVQDQKKKVSSTARGYSTLSTILDPQPVPSRYVYYILLRKFVVLVWTLKSV